MKPASLRLRLATVAAAGLAVWALAPAPDARAQECTASKAASEMTMEETAALYDCLRPRLVEAYQQQGNETAAAYTDWQAAAKQPAAPGFHGERFLMTYVNDTGHETYVAYGTEDVAMPVGSVIAKESFKISDKLEVQLGPLFLMTKVAAGEADEFGNWVYGGVTPGGGEMKVSQKFCHDCHSQWESQDSLGYPVEEVRLGN